MTISIATHPPMAMPASQKQEIEPEFDDEGYNSIYSTDVSEESERERGRKNELGRLARRRFEAMLRALSGRRHEIARCMAFSLEHAEAAGEVGGGRGEGNEVLELWAGLSVCALCEVVERSIELQHT